VVVPYLRFRGIRAVDRLVVSHDDDDHKGGAASVLDLMPVAEFLHGPSLGNDAPDLVPAQTRRGTCRRGDHWQWDGVRFEWWHPGPGPYVRDNDSSCVLHVRAANGQSLLLAGDVERTGEAEMLAAATVVRVDAIVVPHHGSRTSSTQAFVVATRPDWAVYAVGHRNRWKFPAPQVVERWEGVGAQGLLTSVSGASTLLLGADRPLVPEQWRRRHPRLWRDP
jgi:competence protein ComEC